MKIAIVALIWSAVASASSISYNPIRRAYERLYELEAREMHLESRVRFAEH